MYTMQDAKDELWTDQPKFWRGYEDGLKTLRFKEYDGVDGQAYDRGYEVGLNEYRARQTSLNAQARKIILGCN